MTLHDVWLRPTFDPETLLALAREQNWALIYDAPRTHDARRELRFRAGDDEVGYLECHHSGTRCVTVAGSEQLAQQLAQRFDHWDANSIRHAAHTPAVSDRLSALSTWMMVAGEAPPGALLEHLQELAQHVNPLVRQAVARLFLFRRWAQLHSLAAARRDSDEELAELWGTVAEQLRSAG